MLAVFRASLRQMLLDALSELRARFVELNGPTIAFGAIDREMHQRKGRRHHR